MAIVLPKFSRRRSPTGLAHETQPALNVALCREDGRYQAGGVLRATYRVSRVPVERLNRIEVSVLWSTDGKGDEDMHVQHFQSIDQEDLLTIDPSKPHGVECRLPVTPLSYHGRLVSVCWCLRVRLFMDDGKEIVAEQPFHLVSVLDPSDPSARRSRHAVRLMEATPGGETSVETVAMAAAGEVTVATLPRGGTQSADISNVSSESGTSGSQTLPDMAAVAEDSNSRILFGRLLAGRHWRRFMDRR